MKKYIIQHDRWGQWENYCGYTNYNDAFRGLTWKLYKGFPTNYQLLSPVINGKRQHLGCKYCINQENYG